MTSVIYQDQPHPAVQVLPKVAPLAEGERHVLSDYDILYFRESKKNKLLKKIFKIMVEEFFKNKKSITTPEYKVCPEITVPIIHFLKDIGSNVQVYRSNDLESVVFRASISRDILTNFYTKAVCEINPIDEIQVLP